MKKHNKDVLRATLFALIAIFIMIGAAGLLFAEHKKKLQKEQQKNAAIEALEKVPTVTPTPAVTATPTPEPTATVSRHRLLRVRLLLMQMITMECGPVRTAWRV